MPPSKPALIRTVSTPEEDLKALRKLRRRAEDLMRTVSDDLRPFLHLQDKVTFRRKPDSPSDRDDVNVTTSCSCLMALALMNRLRDVYAPGQSGEKGIQIAKDSIIRAMTRLVQAPWMSSGLTENNSFTTTLMLRLAGYLTQSGALTQADLPRCGLKSWDLRLGITAPDSLAKKIFSRSTPLLKFLYHSLSDPTRRRISECIESTPPKSLSQEAIEALTVDINTIIHGSSFYEPSRFPATKLSDTAKAAVSKRLPTGYALSQLHHTLLQEMLPKEFNKPPLRSLEGIARALGSNPNNFWIGRYPPTAAVVYWFVDAVDRSKIALRDQEWERLCSWASEEFHHQQLLVVAESEAMMDPVAMAMAACICRRLKTIASQSYPHEIEASFSCLPSETELQESILKLLPKQTRTGIWPKYFPMFHYREGGSNYCFTLEMLEAVLVEFGFGKHSLIQNHRFVRALEKALDWCENNRQEYKKGKTLYTGWISGHDTDTLKKGQPESWATAVAHMFLWELHRALSTAIHFELLEKYEAKIPDDHTPAWQEVLDAEVPLLSRDPSTVKTVLEREIMGALTLAPGDINSRKLRTKLLHAGKGTISFFIKGNLSKGTRRFLEKLGQPDEATFRKRLITDLNKLINGDLIYTKERFQHVQLSADSKALLAADQVPTDIRQVNRRLLQDAYPNELDDLQLSGHARQYKGFQLEKMKGRRSVLLFGPPGTSKTTLVRAFAAELRWPLLEIEPSHFLTNGMEGIYGRAREIFDDLGEISGVVVFFDEMDALVRTREDQAHPLDAMSRFLTTSMLPKLAKLHDDGRVVFFFATNYQGEFDQAIKRPGRFDILLCVWPPTWETKISSLSKLVPATVKPRELSTIETKLKRLVAHTKAEERQILDLMTFSETRGLLETLSKDSGLLPALKALEGDDFSKKLVEFEPTITLRRDKPTYQRYSNERTISQLQ